MLACRYADPVSLEELDECLQRVVDLPLNVPPSAPRLPMKLPDKRPAVHTIPQDHEEQQALAISILDAVMPDFGPTNALDRPFTPDEAGIPEFLMVDNAIVQREKRGSFAEVARKSLALTAQLAAELSEITAIVAEMEDQIAAKKRSEAVLRETQGALKQLLASVLARQGSMARAQRQRRATAAAARDLSSARGTESLLHLRSRIQAKRKEIDLLDRQILSAEQARGYSTQPTPEAQPTALPFATPLPRATRDCDDAAYLRNPDANAIWTADSNPTEIPLRHDPGALACYGKLSVARILQESRALGQVPCASPSPQRQAAGLACGGGPRAAGRSGGGRGGSKKARIAEPPVAAEGGESRRGQLLLPSLPSPPFASCAPLER
ncbi:hypothetical protein DIPPA_34953 [Diplonema papillatum]|nr:hypothetical protein DIPPA_34953 [Diplonema papillatum]